MIELWNPLWLFGFFTVMAGATAISMRGASDQPLSFRIAISTMVFHGIVGGALGMQLYEWQKIVWASLMISVAYGAGAVKLPEVRAILRGILNGNGNGSNGK